MPNEFEKQVQQMMDELKLVPSEPVWQKVELQIRKKKDRRRLIFWISFLALLLSGGLWIGVSEYSNKVSYKKDTSTGKEIKKAIDNNLPVTTTKKSIDKKTFGHTTVKMPAKPTDNEKIERDAKAKNNNVVLNIEPNIQGNVSKKSKAIKEVSDPNKKGITVKLEKIEPGNIDADKVVVQKSDEQNPDKPLSNSDTVSRKEITNAISIEPNKNEPAIVPAPDSVERDTATKNDVQNQDTSAIKKTEVKKYATSKWKLNLIATVGSSNMKDLNLFNGWFGGEKSLAAPNYSGGGSQSGGLPLYYGPSDIKEGFSFAVGAAAKKQIARRMFFSMGLRYNYYSNTIQVGNKINQNRILMDFAVSQYYSNTGISLQPYHNRYHFVSVPIAMDWQLVKKAPLNFYTGLSLQYLVKTNGLVFDNATQSYFYSKDAFNRVQLFFEPALTYTVSFKQKVLTFGPQLQYGLSRLEKNNTTYHLASYGLKAQLQFGKK